MKQVIMNSHKKQDGFTIVELLVVVVVIAILATITILSYSGITKKAEQVSILTQVDYYEKTIRMYQQTYGDWPQMPALNNNFRACLGGGYDQITTSPTMANGVCWVASDSTTALAAESTTLNSSLSEFSNAAPKSNPKIINFPSGGRFRGVVYHVANNVPPTGKTATIYFAPDGNNECGRGTAGSISEGGTIYNLCALTLK